MSTTGDFTLAANGPAANQPPSAEFIQLFTKTQRSLFLYILSLVPRPVDADEILQETNLIVWTKSHQFQPGTNFRAWASQIAYYEVLKYRERKQRDKLHFNPDLLEMIAAESLQQAELLDRRRQALAECLLKLRDTDRALIQTRYSPDGEGPGIADQLGRPINSIYQSLSRIRKTLLECINRRLAAEVRG